MPSDFSSISRSEILTQPKAWSYNQEHITIPDHIRLIASNTFSKKTKYRPFLFRLV